MTFNLNSALMGGILLTFTFYSSGQSDAVKYENAIHIESEVPAYILPPLLKTFNGENISNKKEWEAKRRPEVLRFFEENLYGNVPTPTDAVISSFELISEDKTHFEGLCTKKEIKITLKNNKGEVSIPLIMFIPNAGTAPYPAIYWVSLLDIKNGRSDHRPETDTR